MGTQLPPRKGAQQVPHFSSFSTHDYFGQTVAHLSSQQLLVSWLITRFRNRVPGCLNRVTRIRLYSIFFFLNSCLLNWFLLLAPNVVGLHFPHVECGYFPITIDVFLDLSKYHRRFIDQCDCHSCWCWASRCHRWGQLLDLNATNKWMNEWMNEKSEN